MTQAPRTRHALIGLTFLVVMAMLVVVSVGIFRQDYTATEKLTVQADRAGLLMESGAKVKLRGVSIGRVTNVEPGGPGAIISLAILPKYMSKIPANVEAQLVPPTIFGAKYVELVPPAEQAAPIAARSIISADHVSVEINSTFAKLMDLLNEVNPAKVNSALTALATAFDGRGAQARDLIALADNYLKRINPYLPTIQDDISKGGSVSGTYADVAPRLIRTGTNVATTSDTLVAQQASLDAFLLGMTRFADDTTKLLRDNERRIVTVLDVMTPTVKELALRSPVLPCFLKAAVYAMNLDKPAIGGKYPGINMYSAFLPGDDPYTYPKDLPVVNADGPPTCYGMPKPGSEIKPYHPFDVGTAPYVGTVAGAGSAGTNGGTSAALSKTALGLLLGLTAVTP